MTPKLLPEGVAARASVTQHRAQIPRLHGGNRAAVLCDAHLMLCAGSVLTRSTCGRTAASCTASEQLHVVFPTPPFPPTKIQRSECASSSPRRCGSMRAARPYSARDSVQVSASWPGWHGAAGTLRNVVCATAH